MGGNSPVRIDLHEKDGGAGVGGGLSMNTSYSVKNDDLSLKCDRERERVT